MRQRIRVDPAAIRYARDRTLDALVGFHGVTLNLYANVRLEKVPFNASTPRDSPMWVVTHLTAYYALVTYNISGTCTKLPGMYAKVHPTMFDEPLKSSLDRVGPVSCSRVLDLEAGTWAGLVSAIRGLSARQLAQEAIGSMREYSADRLACVEAAVWHEGWHAGDVASVRRARGLKPVFA